MQNPSEAVQQHLRFLSIICGAILSGVVIFSGVVWYLLNAGGFTPPEGLPGFTGTLANVVALVAILKAALLPRLFPPPGRGAAETDLLAWHRKNTVLGFALREAGGLIALVGVLLTGRQAGGFAMAGLAVVSMALAWPRRDQLLE
jgi:hypothetical protein